MKRKVYLTQFTLFFIFFTFSQNLIAQDFSLSAELTISDLNAFDRLGQSSVSVSESGNYAIIGSNYKKVDGISNAGAAYIFKRDSNGDWSELKKVVDQTLEKYAFFAYGLSISDEYAIISISEKSIGGVSDAGMVHIYKKDEGGPDNWGLIKEMTAPTPGADHSFGKSVFFSNNYLIIGASDVSSRGKIYIYHKDMGGMDNWGEVKQITLPNPINNDYFGQSVSLSGDYLIAGASSRDIGGVNGSGAAYIFHKDEGGIDNWGLIKELTTPTLQQNAKFGISVSISGDYAVVGSNGVSFTGAAYIFHRDEGGIDNWGLIKGLSAPTPQQYANFGSSVSMSGDYILLGAGGETVAGMGYAGAAYMYHKDEGGIDNWGLQERITLQNPVSNDNLGRRVSISGDNAMISASDKTINGMYRVGAAYMYEKCTSLATNGKRGGMLDFDGLDDYVSIIGTSGLPQGADPRTIEAWVKTTQTSVGNIVSWGRKSGNMRSSVVVDGGKLGFVTEGQSLMGSVTVNDGEWHHIAVTYESNTVNLYVDGMLDASFTIMMPLNTTDQNLILGRESMPGTSEYYEGAVDEIRIWDMVLSQLDIRRQMHSTTGWVCGEDPITYFQFNGDDLMAPNGIKDNSRNLNDGTANNMTEDDLLPSEVAVGEGSSSIQNITGTGLVSFPDEGVDIDFGTSPDGDVAVTRITTEQPTGALDFSNGYNQYFIIKNYGTNASPDVNGITFHSVSSIPANTQVSDIELYKRAGNAYGDTWGVEIATASTITDHPDATVTFTGAPLFSGFSQFALNNGGSAASLPVELEDFHGRNDGDANHLYWVTASEVNNRGFGIERSLDGSDFRQIGFVEGNGTTVEKRSYDFTDENPHMGINYYRLKQMDHDDSYEYSEVISIRTLLGNSPLVLGELYPNPSKTQIVHVNYFAKENMEMSLRIFDTSGQLQQSRDINIDSGQHRIEIDFMDHNKGIYFIEFQSGDIIERRKLIMN